MNQPLISVIIPVYNTEKYLSRCLESVLQQLYQNLEIILVDDGSTDNSGRICDVFSELDGRICVFHVANQGPASARNHGMDVAKGEWITFVDADDYISPEHISSMYRLVKDVSSVAVSDISRIDVAGRMIGTFSYMGVPQVYRESIFGYIHNKLFHRSFISDVRFPNIRFAEDLIFNYILYEKRPRYLFTNLPTYNYVQLEHSLSSQQVTEAKISALLDFSELIWLRYCSVFEEKEEALKEYTWQVGNCTCNFLCAICLDPSLSLRRKTQMMRRLMCGSLKHLRFRYAKGILLKILFISKQIRLPILFYILYRTLIYLKGDGIHG